MLENADQNNSEYGHFLRSECFLAYFYYIGKSENQEWKHVLLNVKSLNEVEMYRHGKKRGAVFKSAARMKLLFSILSRRRLMFQTICFLFLRAY